MFVHFDFWIITIIIIIFQGTLVLFFFIQSPLWTSDFFCK
jgi:hypothetical protein